MLNSHHSVELSLYHAYCSYLPKERGSDGYSSFINTAGLQSSPGPLLWDQSLSLTVTERPLKHYKANLEIQVHGISYQHGNNNVELTPFVDTSSTCTVQTIQCLLKQMANVSTAGLSVVALWLGLHILVTLYLLCGLTNTVK